MLSEILDARSFQPHTHQSLAVLHRSWKMTESGTIDASLRNLAKELRKENENQMKIGDLKEHIQMTKTRLQNMLNSVDERVNRLTSAISIQSDVNKKEMALQSEKAAKLGTESAAGTLSDSSLHSVDSECFNHFNDEIQILRSRLDLLRQLEAKTRLFRKDTAGDSSNLKKAQEKMKEIESVRAYMVTKMQPPSPIEERQQCLGAVTGMLAALDRLAQLANTTPEEKTKIDKIAREIRDFLRNMPDMGSVPPFEMDTLSDKSWYIPFTKYSCTDVEAMSIGSQTTASVSSVSMPISSISASNSGTNLSESAVSIKSNSEGSKKTTP